MNQVVGYKQHPPSFQKTKTFVVCSLSSARIYHFLHWRPTPFQPLNPKPPLEHAAKIIFRNYPHTVPLAGLAPPLFGKKKEPWRLKHPSAFGY
jgi:hypothetical protein